MRIAVMATGGVGGYFGARLAAAGEDVQFIARGAHLAALRTHGLHVRSAVGHLHLSPISVTDDPVAIGPVDIVLLAVKLWDLEAAGAACLPLIGPETAVISFVNGVDAEERLVPIVGAANLMGGAAYISASIAAPGVIEHTGTAARLVFGEFDGSLSARAHAFDAACKAAGFAATLTAEIRRDLWIKMALLASFSGITSVTRMPLGPVRSEHLTRRLLLDAIAEVVAVAAKQEIDLGAGFIDRQLALVDGLPAEMKASMLVDLERGNRLELDWLSGAVARLGDQLGVPTPVHHFLYAALKLHAMGTHG